MLPPFKATMMTTVMTAMVLSSFMTMFFSFVVMPPTFSIVFKELTERPMIHVWIHLLEFLIKLLQMLFIFLLLLIHFGLKELID
jgi:hypothetical protein